MCAVTSQRLENPRRRPILFEFAACCWAVLGLIVLVGCARVEVVAPSASGERSQVDLLILQSPSGGTLAFLPVYINGAGPFAFALDTGASHSVIDAALARRLGLPIHGEKVQVSGIAARRDAQATELTDWRIGEVTLPANVAVTFDLPDDEVNMQGLLGSDVLSQFGEVTIDYDHGRLYLQAR